MEKMMIKSDEIKRMKSESRRSVLWSQIEEIRQMREEGISYQIIKNWLEDNGIRTSIQNIRQFYLRNETKVKKPKIKKKTTFFENLKKSEDEI
jgi:hypothetical protein